MVQVLKNRMVLGFFVGGRKITRTQKAKPTTPNLDALSQPMKTIEIKINIANFYRSLFLILE